MKLASLHSFVSSPHQSLWPFLAIRTLNITHNAFSYTNPNDAEEQTTLLSHHEKSQGGPDPFFFASREISGRHLGRLAFPK